MPGWGPDLVTSNGKVVSSFSIIKGSLIPETYAAFAGWNLDETSRQNLDRLRTTNHIGARSAAWLEEVVSMLRARFDPAGRDRPLVLLAKSGCAVETWKPLLLWHMTRDDFLLRDFLIHWLYPAYEAGSYRLRPKDLRDFLLTLERRGGKFIRPWTEATLQHVARGLLKMAADFDLLKGSAVKEFASYHLPEVSFLYVLHALAEAEPNARRIVESPEWRIYLMRQEDVERELLRLHQFRKLEYQVAGSLGQLRLPCATAADFAEKDMP